MELGLSAKRGTDRMSVISLSRGVVKLRFTGFCETEMIEFLVTHKLPWVGRRFLKEKKGLAGGGRDGERHGAVEGDHR